MKVLRLGNSDDTAGPTPREGRSYAIAERALAKASGEPVETVRVAFWPNDKALARLEELLDAKEPDVVELVVATFWYTYASVPLKLRRRYGAVGRLFANIGLRAADVGWLAGTAAFRAGRRLALRTIGGATYFEPEQVIERMEACIRRLLREEELALVVCNPYVPMAYDSPRRLQVEAERRRQRVHQALEALCEELHVTYVGFDEVSLEAERNEHQQDMVHLNAAGHARLGAIEGEALVQAWSASRSG